MSSPGSSTGGGFIDFAAGADRLHVRLDELGLDFLRYLVTQTKKDGAENTAANTLPKR
jgi:hypothetical protein